MTRGRSEMLTAESSHGWYQAPWQTAIPFALAITLFLLGLFTYWFGAADRKRIFIYYLDMGPLVPDTSPFSAVTASRYWMSALVATGAVTVLYSASNRPETLQVLNGNPAHHLYEQNGFKVVGRTATHLLMGSD